MSDRFSIFRSLIWELYIFDKNKRCRFHKHIVRLSFDRTHNTVRSHIFKPIPICDLLNKDVLVIIFAVFESFNFKEF